MMKETIYTIPLMEAFDKANNCPFCYLHRKTENEGVEYTLGPSMMEPDCRTQSNEIGFCAAHLEKMYASGNKLSLALMLSTHMEKLMNTLKVGQEKLGTTKKGLFVRGQKENAASDIAPQLTGCVICKHILYHMTRYLDVFLHMWKKEADFRAKVQGGCGFCMHHTLWLMEGAFAHYPQNDYIDFTKMLFALQADKLQLQYQELLEFIDMFDYRSRTSDKVVNRQAVKMAMLGLRGGELDK